MPRTRSAAAVPLRGLGNDDAFMCGFNLPHTADLPVACRWVQRLSGSGLARGAAGGTDMRLEHATHLAQHWELDVAAADVVKAVLAKAVADGHIANVRGRDARGHKRRKCIGTRRKKRAKQ